MNDQCWVNSTIESIQQVFTLALLVARVLVSLPYAHQSVTELTRHVIVVLVLVNDIENLVWITASHVLNHWSHSSPVKNYIFLAKNGLLQLLLLFMDPLSDRLRDWLIFWVELDLLVGCRVGYWLLGRCLVNWSSQSWRFQHFSCWCLFHCVV